jgi:hypothetical protein
MVSRAVARVISGKMVVRRRASIDVPAPGGPQRRRLRSTYPHPLQFRESFSSSVPQGRLNWPSLSAPPLSLLTAPA